ncbi:IclR family transcriptional regulator [uncultured Planococcus sp.]|uniref:IclR family transcriptional regulator n=1 Tax=uncultured Planococcus sp. TaxID=337815 RepID=UPI002632B97D|nr:IclR family transcriptional regulator [uncultured Planococcus sp.]
MNFTILQLFHSYGSPLHIEKILQETNVPRSSLYRQIKALTQAGLLETAGKGLYAPGWLVDEISRVKENSFDFLVENALSIMQELSDDLGESINLTAVKGSKVMVLAHLESKHNLRYSYEEGQVLDIFKGASSKILLAYLTEEHRQFLLNSSLSPEEGEKLEQELTEIRNKGYSLTNSEVDESAIGISAPILRGGKYIMGGLSIAGPDFRINGDKIDTYIHRLKEAAADISLMME